MYTKSEQELENLGELGHQHVSNNYSFEKFNKQWVDLMCRIYENYGSWDTRKNYNNIRAITL